MIIPLDDDLAVRRKNIHVYDDSAYQPSLTEELCVDVYFSASFCWRAN